MIKAGELVWRTGDFLAGLDRQQNFCVLDVLPVTIPYRTIRDGRCLVTGDSACIGSIAYPDLGRKAEASAIELGKNACGLSQGRKTSNGEIV